MNEHKNIITIEDEIKEFSDKPVKSSAIHKTLGAMEQAMNQALEEHGVPDSSEASVGDVLTKGEGGVGWSAPSGGGEAYVVQNHIVEPFTIDGHAFDPEVDEVYEQGNDYGETMVVVDKLPEVPSVFYHCATQGTTETWNIFGAFQRRPASDDMGGDTTTQGFYVKPNAHIIITPNSGTLVAKDSIAYGTIYYYGGN